MAEYLDLLHRPVLLPHALRAQEVLALITKFAVHVSPTDTLSLCSDADDNRFVECAVTARAAYVVTGNIRHFPKSYEAVAVVTPRALLRHLIADLA